MTPMNEDKPTVASVSGCVVILVLFAALVYMVIDSGLWQVLATGGR